MLQFSSGSCSVSGAGEWRSSPAIASGLLHRRPEFGSSSARTPPPNLAAVCAATGVTCPAGPVRSWLWASSGDLGVPRSPGLASDRPTHQADGRLAVCRDRHDAVALPHPASSPPGSPWRARWSRKYSLSLLASRFRSYYSAMLIGCRSIWKWFMTRATGYRLPASPSPPPMSR